MRLLLKNLRVNSEGKSFPADLRVGRGRILDCSLGIAPRSGELVLNLSGYLALPGLINSHDHLEFNLFPRLGHPPYENFYQWAREIYHPKETPVREILQVPLVDRLWWGAYKNLISGVTTVVHHNVYRRRSFNRRFPIRVLKRYGWSHSLGHGNGIEKAFAKSRGRPYIIHAGEGIDLQSSEEIDALYRMGLLHENTVLVHGIAIQADKIDLLSNANTSLVWCPASNIYLFDRTADIRRLQGRIQLTLGTDSTMSGSPTLLDELRAAYKACLASPEELLKMVTSSAASVFQLSDGRGTLRPGAPADLLLLRDDRREAAEILLSACPKDIKLVLVNGVPRFADQTFADMLRLGNPNVFVDKAPKWIYGDLNSLRNRVREAVGEKILSQNPIWNLFEEKELQPVDRTVVNQTLPSSRISLVASDRIQK
ncbi:MAG: amidohydrolase family protein [bacterium]